MLYLYGRPVPDQDARNLVAMLIGDGSPEGIAAASQIGHALELDRVMVGLTPAMRDAILAVLDSPPPGLLDLRGALARDRVHRRTTAGFDDGVVRRAGLRDRDPGKHERSSLVVGPDNPWGSS